MEKKNNSKKDRKNYELGEKAFLYCRSLTNLTIPDSVTKIGEEAFNGCSALTNITIPDSVTKIGKEAFYYCDSLTNLIIPNSVIQISNSAFKGCESLTSITIPDSVEEIGYNAFCGVDTIYYNGNAKGSTWGANQVINNNCDYIEVKLNETVLKQLGYNIEGKYDSEHNYTKYIKKNGQDIETLDIPSNYLYEGKNYKIVQIGNWLFNNCRFLTNVTIPNGVTIINDGAFKGCESLKMVTIPNSVTKIGERAFYDCPLLTNIIIPNSVTKIVSYDAFENVPHIEYHGAATGAPWGAKSMN